MDYAAQEIGIALKEARDRKGLSQRALARSAGVPQGQISKIENGAVDLRLSSLIALARALDMEPLLIPRKAVAAVKSVAASAAGDSRGGGRSSPEIRAAFEVLDAMPAAQKAHEEFAQLRRTLRDLQIFPLSDDDRQVARKALSLIDRPADRNTRNRLRDALLSVRTLRNRLVHSDAGLPEPVGPAYSLNGDEADG